VSTKYSRKLKIICNIKTWVSGYIWLVSEHSTPPPTANIPLIMTTSSENNTAFFYGTLMAPRVLSRVCFGPNLPNSTTSRLSLLTFSSALLPGYRRHRVVGADYPGIIENANSEVRGTLVTGLTDGDLWRLDTFEGDEYVRRKVKVNVLKQEANKELAKKDAVLPPPAVDSPNMGDNKVEALTYVWIGGFGSLEPAEWDFDEFVREKMWRWVDEEGENEGEYRG
jgi:hypothetical protein